MKDVKAYTAIKLGEQLLTAELHLTDYLQGISDGSEESDFCVECLAKHSLAISGLAHEGTQFFNGAKVFSSIYVTANNLYNTLPDFNLDKAKEYFDKLRGLRKNLVAQHLILGVNINNDKPNSLNHLTDCPNCKG